MEIWEKWFNNIDSYNELRYSRYLNDIDEALNGIISDIKIEASKCSDISLFVEGYKIQVELLTKKLRGLYSCFNQNLTAEFYLLPSYELTTLLAKFLDNPLHSLENNCTIKKLLEYLKEEFNLIISTEDADDLRNDIRICIGYRHAHEGMDLLFDTLDEIHLKSKQGTNRQQKEENLSSEQPEDVSEMLQHKFKVRMYCIHLWLLFKCFSVNYLSLDSKERNAIKDYIHECDNSNTISSDIGVNLKNEFSRFIDKVTIRDRDQANLSSTLDNYFKKPAFKFVIEKFKGKNLEGSLHNIYQKGTVMHERYQEEIEKLLKADSIEYFYS